MYPLALEGALKLKEISYIHAEGYASGRAQARPHRADRRTMPVVVMAPHDSLFDKTVSNMQEVMARAGKVVLITDRAGADRASDGTWAPRHADGARIPRADPLCDPGAASGLSRGGRPRGPTWTSRATSRNPSVTVE
jgi:glutamine---fructose-6-phosphate transaminase (isomerizing)